MAAAAVISVPTPCPNCAVIKAESCVPGALLSVSLSQNPQASFLGSTCLSRNYLIRVVQSPGFALLRRVYAFISNHQMKVIFRQRSSQQKQKLCHCERQQAIMQSRVLAAIFSISQPATGLLCFFLPQHVAACSPPPDHLPGDFLAGEPFSSEGVPSSKDSAPTTFTVRPLFLIWLSPLGLRLSLSNTIRSVVSL